MKHKLNKQKGFTLIELLVVIAIIALLSSIVLASLKSARERAEAVQILTEVKSLQVAIEMYRNEFGVYPGTNPSDFWSDSTLNNVIIDYTHPHDNFYTNVQNYLVNKKLISKSPRSKKYPNNCIDNINCSILF